MRFRVTLLRIDGRRRSQREIDSGPSYVGDLRTHYMTGSSAPYKVATLHTGNGLTPEPVADLYEPVLATIAPHAVILRGYERIGEGHQARTVMQEWRCEPDDAMERERSTISEAPPLGQRD